MADIQKPWGGTFQFNAANDLLLVTNENFARQRIIHGLLTGPVQKDEAGRVLVPADNLFAQDHGAGLGRDVEGLNDAQHRADQDARIKTYLATEPVVDQSKKIEVQFAKDDEKGIEYVAIACTTAEGDPLVAILTQ